MDIFNDIMELSPVRLTVLEQARVENNLPELEWDQYFPRTNADSIHIRELTTVDFRPVADRRAWDARGRQIPLKKGPRRDVEMVPIEAYFKIGEKEMQNYAARNSNDRDAIIRAMKADIPSRVESLVDADFRRLEYESFQGWANNEFTVMNPETEAVETIALLIDSARYLSPSAWTGGSSGTAYDLFLSFLYDAENALGSLRGAMMRRTTWNAIAQSAPALNNVQATKRQVEERIADELGYQFTIEVNERTVDLFDGAGSATTATKIWPANHVAAIPASGIIGSTHFAPQVRAQAFAEVAGQMVDIRSVGVYFEKENNGKTLSVEAQLNALALPSEQSVYVVDAGI